jgi:hypothetical protein
MKSLEDETNTIIEKRVIGIITSSKVVQWPGRKLTMVYIFPENSLNSRERIPIFLRGEYKITKGTKISVVYEPLDSGINVSKAYTNLKSFQSS